MQKETAGTFNLQSRDAGEEPPPLEGSTPLADSSSPTLPFCPCLSTRTRTPHSPGSAAPRLSASWGHCPAPRHVNPGFQVAAHSVFTITALGEPRSSLRPPLSRRADPAEQLSPGPFRQLSSFPAYMLHPIPTPARAE